MIKSLYSAASGMHAQQTNLDNIANNIANANTTAFKRTRVEFQDLVYETLRGTAPTEQGTTIPTELQIGGGAKPVATVKNFEPGAPQNTGNPLDFMIRGDGLFQVLMPDGSLAYTRDGAWKLSADGQLVTANGLPMEPPLTIPQDATSILVNNDGRVLVMTASATEPTEIGRIELARFMNPAGLTNLGDNLYKQTIASGDPIVAQPGLDGTGTIDQGYLEASNVKIVNEMIALITAQRSYELNSKSVRTADDMIGIAANLKR
ncbi:flagellar basal-body rod protein FlgG [bacterium]|nr:flagellar basal-body rod protein FlgG [bacterium]MBU1983836.1 flagellar basal-body rod protein FlgG [bacterium]